MNELGKKIRHVIDIRPSDNMGYIVKIGCGKFVASDNKELLEIINAFISDPTEQERQYYAGKGVGMPKTEKAPNSPASET